MWIVIQTLLNLTIRGYGPYRSFSTTNLALRHDRRSFFPWLGIYSTHTVRGSARNFLLFNASAATSRTSVFGTSMWTA